MNVDSIEILATSVTIVNLPVREELAPFRSSVLVPSQKQANKRKGRRFALSQLFKNHGFLQTYMGRKRLQLPDFLMQILSILRNKKEEAANLWGLNFFLIICITIRQSKPTEANGVSFQVILYVSMLIYSITFTIEYRITNQRNSWIRFQNFIGLCYVCP